MLGWLARRLLLLAFALGLGVGGGMGAVHAASADDAVAARVMASGWTPVHPAEGVACQPCDGAGDNASAEVACVLACPPTAAAMLPAEPALREPGAGRFRLQRMPLPASLLGPPEPYPPRSATSL
jgi:hypothetical protein